MDKKINQVYLWDHMVLIGLGVGAVYLIIECLLYNFLSYQVHFLDRLFGSTLDEMSTRIIVICLFLIFGSHAQYSIYKRKQIEEDLLQLKEMYEKLKLAFEEQKNQKGTYLGNWTGER